MPPKRRAYAALVTVFVVWGTTYLAIRIALETVPPFLMAAIRWITAGTALLAVLRARGERWPGPREWPTLAVLGVLFMTIGNGGVVWAEQYVPSGLTAVLVAVTPFWLVGVDALMPGGERLTLRRIAGLVVGFGGIVLLVWPELEIRFDPRFLGGLIAAQMACLGWAAGSTYSRTRAREENVLAAVAFQMLFGGLALLGLGAARHEWASFAVNARTFGALLYLVVVGSLAGFSSYAYALKHLPIATVSLYAYVNPVIAVALGTLVLSEPISWRMGMAVAIVLTGVGLVRAEH